MAGAFTGDCLGNGFRDAEKEENPLSAMMPPAHELAAQLLQAQATATPIQPFSERFAGYNTEAAYRIQQSLVEQKLAQGHVIIGKKIGFTSEKLRQQYNVSEPDYGVLFEDCVLMEHEPLEIDRLYRPRVEAEIAFILKGDLDKPGVTVADVVRATEGIMPAIEIVDTRFEDWRVTVSDTIADQAGNARIVLGGVMQPLSDFDLRFIGLSIFKNGKLMDSATGSTVFGNPVHAVVWLANKMYELGSPLQKGEVIMSGSFTPVFPIGKGDYVEAIFDRLGKVTVFGR